MSDFLAPAGDLRRLAFFDEAEHVAAILSPAGQVVELNRVAADLLGYPAPAAPAPAVWELPAFAAAAPAREWLRGAVARAAAGEPSRGDVDVTSATGDRTLALAVRAHRDDSGGIVLSLAGHDVTEQRRRERENAFLTRLAVAISRTDSVDLATAATLQQVCESTGWVLGEAWLARGTGTGRRLERRAVWSVHDRRIEEFAAQGRGLTFDLGEGLPGHAWVTGRPVSENDLRDPTYFTRAPLSAHTPITGAVAIPVLAGDDVVAVLLFYTAKSVRDEAQLVRIVSAVAAQLGTFLLQKQAEEAHRVAEARLAGMVSIASDAIISTDQSRRITIFNWGAERVFGYSADEMLGQSLDVLIPETLRAAHVTHMARFSTSAVSTRRMGERDRILGLRKNGEIFPAEASISRFSVGGASAYTVILRDISDRVRNEEGLRFLAEAGALLADVLDDPGALQRVAERAVPTLADVCILELTQDDGAIRTAAIAATNPSVRDAIRAFRERAPQTWEVSTPVVRAMREAAVVSLPGDASEWSPSSVPPANLEVARATGLGSLLVVPLRARGRVLGALTLAMAESRRQHDETYRVLAEELAVRVALAVDNAALYAHARRAVAVRDEIMSIVSHDLRTPLAVVSMCLSAIVEDPPSDAETITELSQSARDSIDWMHRLIHDLLDVTRIEAGRLSLERRRLPLGPVVTRAVDMFRPLLYDHELALTLEDTDGAGEALVDVDAERLVQVLANLLSNAIKFTPAGGAVRVAIARTPDRVEVAVSDSGCGIPAEHLPHVFDRFWHARKSATEGSTGLGLAIAKGIVDAHGGTIRAASEPDRGSTFTIALPLAG